MLLTSCATPTPSLHVKVPESLRANCASPDPSSVSTVGDLAAHSVRQEAALQVCDAKRSALVSIIEAANEAVKKKRWGLW